MKAKPTNERKRTKDRSVKEEPRIRQFVEASRNLLGHLAQKRRSTWRTDVAALTPIYCIDNDVLKLYLNPAAVGARGRHPNDAGYGVVFPEDEDADAGKIAAILADFLFDHLQPELPLLQLTPIAEEAMEVLGAIQKHTKRKYNWRQSFAELESSAIDDLTEKGEIASDGESSPLSEIAKLLKFTKRDEQLEAAAGKTIEEFFVNISADLELVRFLSLVVQG